MPVPCHSHNDYWRRIPLFDAVHAGCSSIEADVWHYGNELYVGHDIPSLTNNRTFSRLYINPLVDILERENPKTPFINATGNGIFDEVPGQTLVLVVDFKTAPDDTWAAVKEQLAPLRDRGYLTHWDGKSVVQGAVTVVGTGNTPFAKVIENTTYRDIFYDAPLQLFSLKAPSPQASQYDSSNSYYASTSANMAVGFPWIGRYTDSQLGKLKDHILGAQKAGLKARYWDTPAWPVGLRNYIWSTLVKIGTDVLNVDDLKGATTGNWGSWG
jgi:hypothetical protein